MAQIVKVSAGQADSGQGRQPRAPVEVAVTHRRAVWAGEDESRSRAKPVKVLAETGCDEIGEGDDAPTGARLGRPERAAAATRVVDLTGNTDGAGARIDVLRGERGELGPAEAGEGGNDQIFEA